MSARIPILGISRLAEAAPAAAPHAPRTALEQAIVDIWRQVLPAPALGPDSDFFELGGDSLSAMQIVARVRQVFDIGLDVTSLLDQPTPAAMAALVETALHAERALPAATPITPVPRDQPLPLSFTQERMWFIQQMAPDNAAYNVASAARLRGPFDLGALEAAFSEVVRRHESLRTTFQLIDGEPRQIVGAPEPFHLAVVAVDGPPEAAYALAGQAAHAPFDLARGPLLRATLFRLSEQDNVLLFAIHHIVTDAWSMGVFAGEVLALVQAARAGQPLALPPLPIQFGDYVVWQRAQLQGAALAHELDYWRQKLSGVSVLELPLDHPRPAVESYHGALTSAELDPEVLRGLRRLSQQAAATLSMVLQAAFMVLLQRYTGQDDVAVGLPIANRREVAIEGLIGAFVNTLILRADLSGAPSFRAALARVRQSSLEAYAHQDVPFAKLVADLNPERSLSHGPLVQVMFNHINVPLPAAPPGELQGDYVELDRGAAQFDLTLTVVDPGPNRPRARLIVEYNTDLFEPGSAARLLRHYARLLSAIAADPDQAISALPLLDDAERQQMLVDWNDTARAYPPASLTELFEAQAARTPDAPALMAGDKTLSFAALNARANQIARALQALGVGPGQVVGLRLARSFDQIAALLGVLKAGAAYLPLDPSYPAERLDYMLDDSGATVDLTPPPFSPTLRFGDHDLNGKGAPDDQSGRVVPTGSNGNREFNPNVAAQASTLTVGTSSPLKVRSVLALNADLGSYGDANLGLSVSLDAPAYLIYTSGSSGQPKGVLAPQRGVLNHCQWVWDHYPFAAGEVGACKTSLNFVDALVELFAPLLAGVPLALAPEETVKDPAALIDWLARHGVTRLAVVLPSLLRAMLERAPDLRARLPRLALVAAGGEALDAALVAQFQAALPGVPLLNWYGSSEDGGTVSSFDCTAPRPAGIAPVGAPAGVPAGRPLANTQLYVLDGARQPVPIGVTGEIYAGGAGLALGYHNRPELTAERFVPDPFRAEPGARLFRTGDLGRWLADGNLLVLGRRDRQVKVRGVRVELDEVQAALAAQPGVLAAAVRAVADSRAGGGTALAGYYTLASGANVTSAELRQRLALRLPESMLPAWLVPLAALPRLPNGKLDPAALPDPNLSGAREDSGPLAPPRTLLESSLARLWAESLGLPAVGIHDNFFELGGHSLLAASLFARMQATLGLDLPLSLLFRAPSVAAMAATISAGGQAPGGLSSLVPLKPSGARPPLFCLHPLGGGVGDYAALARHLDAEQPFYGLRAKGLDDERYQAATIEALAADYLAEIRALQPAGPYRLAGYSSGGLIAFEMARQLSAAGQAVALVALLDSYAPAVPGQSRLRPAALLNMAASLPHWLADLGQLERRQLLARLRRRRLSATQGAAAITADDYLGAGALAALPARHRAFVEAHWQAVLAYQPQPWAGRVTLFRAQAQALSRAADPDKGWGALALGGVDIRQFPGSHRTLLSEPWVAGLAAAVQGKLDELGH